MHSAHPDLRGAQWDKKFYATETGKKYKALGQSWISAYKKLTPDGKSWIKLNPNAEVNEINVMKSHINLHNTNLFDTLHDISHKPIVAMKLSNEDAGSEAYFKALIDPASFSDDAQDKSVASYIARGLANDIYKSESFRKSITACACKPATTSTAVGCLVSNSCIALACALLDNRAATDNVQASFRAVEALGDNDVAIGLSDARRRDLATKLKRLHVDEVEATPTRIRSTTHSKGEDAEATNDTKDDMSVWKLQKDEI